MTDIGAKALAVHALRRAADALEAGDDTPTGVWFEAHHPMGPDYRDDASHARTVASGSLDDRDWYCDEDRQTCWVACVVVERAEVRVVPAREEDGRDEQWDVSLRPVWTAAEDGGRVVSCDVLADDKALALHVARLLGLPCDEVDRSSTPWKTVEELIDDREGFDRG